MTQDLGQTFVSLLFNSRNLIRFAMDDKFKPLGITDATWRTLYFLRQEGNAVQQKVLAKTMAIEGLSLVRLLDSPSAKRFIERRTDPNDRRSKTIDLTSHADSILSDLDQLAIDVRTGLFANIKETDMKACICVFNQILAGE